MRGRLVAAVATLAAAVAGVTWVAHATPERHAAGAPAACPAVLRGSGDLWAVVRGDTIGAYALRDVRLCPGAPRLVRMLHADVGWVSSGGGVTAVVQSGGRRDAVALYDHGVVRPLDALNAQGTAVTPAVSPAGDVAVVVRDRNTGAMTVQVVTRGGAHPRVVYAAPPGRTLSSPAWSAGGVLAAVERSGAGMTGAVDLVVVTGAATPRPTVRRVPTDRANATTALWLDARRVVLGDFAAAPGAGSAVFDVERGATVEPLPAGLLPVAVVPGRAALVARDRDNRLVLLAGGDLDEVTVLGGAGAYVAQGAFATG